MAVVAGIPRESFSAGTNTVSATIRVGDRPFEVWFRCAAGPLYGGAEPFLAAALIPAMKAGGPLTVEGEISSQLLADLAELQDILATWHSELRPVRIIAQARDILPKPPGGGVAAFFSGGVDSFYSLLKHGEEINKLIFVHGFDVALDNRDLAGKVTQALRQAALESGKPLIEVQTNIRTLLDEYGAWGLQTHGAAMAAVAFLLSTQVQRIFVPSSRTYRNLLPWGTHPLTDRLWKTPATSLVHDGADTARGQKVACIARNETALRWLRVCWLNTGGAYNCGRCEKCMRTMIQLRLAGALDRCKTFDRGLDLEAIANMTVVDANMLALVRENALAVEQAGSDPELARALQACLRKAQAPPPAAPRATSRKSSLLQRILLKLGAAERPGATQPL